MVCRCVAVVTDEMGPKHRFSLYFGVLRVLPVSSVLVAFTIASWLKQCTETSALPGTGTQTFFSKTGVPKTTVYTRQEHQRVISLLGKSGVLEKWLMYSAVATVVADSS